MTKQEMISGRGLARVWSNVTDKFEPNEEGKHLSTNDFTNENKATLLAMNDKITTATEGTYKVKGTVIAGKNETINDGEIYTLSVADFGTSDFVIGEVYHIQLKDNNSKFKISDEESFMEGIRGKSFPTGTNMVYTSEGFDVLGGTYDFSDYMMKEDITPIDSDHITNTCVIPDPVTNIVIGGGGENRLEFSGIQENINFETKYDELQTISLDLEGIGRSELEYAITDTPVVVNIRSRKAKSSSPYDNLNWHPYTGPFTLPYGNSIIYTRIKSVNGEWVYSCTNGIHIHEYEKSTERYATCTLNKIDKYTCKHCNEFYTEEVQNSAYGHDYRWVTKNATCTQAGSRQYKCSRCDDISESEQIPALGHNMELYHQTTATCTSPAKKIYKCSRCSERSEETTGTMLHNWGMGDDITAGAECTQCGDHLRDLTSNSVGLTEIIIGSTSYKDFSSIDFVHTDGQDVIFNFDNFDNKIINVVNEMDGSRKSLMGQFNNNTMRIDSGSIDNACEYSGSYIEIVRYPQKSDYCHYMYMYSGR